MLQHSTCPRKAFLAAGDAITPPFPGAGDAITCHENRISKGR